MKKTVSAYGYAFRSVKTPSQNFWTLFTTPTMRQSWRVFVLARPTLGRDLAGGVALADPLIIERRQLTSEPPSPPESSVKAGDDDPSEAEPSSADGEPATHAAAADVGDLAGIEPGALFGNA